MGLELPLRLEFPDDEEEIVNKYFKPAKLKTQIGDYESAIKLLDTGLKTKPDSLGFKIMKAYVLYLIAEDHKTDEIEELSEEASEAPESSHNVWIKIQDIMKEKLDYLEKSIILLNDVLAKEKKDKSKIQKFLFAIEDYAKAIGKQLKATEKTLSQFQKIKKDGIEIAFVCPYCDKNFLTKSNASGEGKITCHYCKKEFKFIYGTARGMKGSTTRIVTYGPPPFVLRLKTNSGEKEIRIQSYNMIDVRAGDLILLTYKMVGFFSKKWSEQPATIHNFTTQLYSVI